MYEWNERNKSGTLLILLYKISKYVCRSQSIPVCSCRLCPSVVTDGQYNQRPEIGGLRILQSFTPLRTLSSFPSWLLQRMNWIKTVAFSHSVSRYLMVETDKIYFEHMTCSHLMSGSNRESCWHDGNDLNSSKKWWTFVPAQIYTKVNIEVYF